MKIAGVAVAGMAAVGSAMPSLPRFSASQVQTYERAKRQSETAAVVAGAAGLTDLDVAQFALTLEFLEATFYQQGFAQFPDDQFTALGLNAKQLADLKSIPATEFAHAGLLQSTIAQAGTAPVQPCTYNFGFTTAAAMVGTASLLENVGIGAYIGAAPILTSKDILTTAATILTVEARHQTFVNTADGVSKAVPGAFDTPLSPKAVFSLAAPFITSCPEGSLITAITAFPTVSAAPGTPAKPPPGQLINVVSDVAAQATACAFKNGDVPGGAIFTAFTPGTGCLSPERPMPGFTYMFLTNAAPATGALTDDIVVAGPLPIQLERQV